ncbi:MAG TPA: CBS domain-containing protein [Polyangiaceae bacterium]
MSKPIPPISKYMTTTPVTVPGDTTLADAAEIMKKHAIRHLPVVDEGKLLGVLTDRDVKFVESFPDVDPARITAEETMTGDPYHVTPDTPLDEVTSTMAEQRYGSAMIMQNGHVVGIFTTVDACRCISDLFATRLRKS